MLPALSELGSVHGEQECLIAREPIHRRPPLRLILEIEIRECLPGRVLHDEGFGVLLDRPGRRESI
jgi:hypothetical protein